MTMHDFRIVVPQRTLDDLARSLAGPAGWIVASPAWSGGRRCRAAATSRRWNSRTCWSATFEPSFETCAEEPRPTELFHLTFQPFA